MGWLEALVLGIVQGLTEFLPISSSAHQSIVGQFFGGEDVGAAFTAITQLGTEAAVIVYFRQDIWMIIKHWSLALVGRLPRDDPEAQDGLARDPRLDPDRRAWRALPGRDRLSAAQSVDHGGDARRFRHHHRDRGPPRAKRPAARVIDLAARHPLRTRAVARADPRVCPGQARRLRPAWPWAIERVAAAQYSFLLAIPAVVGSGFFKLADVSNDPVEPAWGPIALATGVAFVIGYAVIAWLLRYVVDTQLSPVRDLPDRARRSCRRAPADRRARTVPAELIAQGLH